MYESRSHVLVKSLEQAGGAKEIIRTFDISTIVFVLGISLFVLGFAVGPLLWAPFSEVLGRRVLFIITYAALTAFNAGAAGSQNVQTLIILRFFAGVFGSSPLTNVSFKEKKTTESLAYSALFLHRRLVGR